MLSNTSVGMAHVVAENLADKGLRAAALPNTPVDAMTTISTQQLQLAESVRDPYQTEKKDLSTHLIEGSSVALEGLNISRHDEVTAAAVDAAVRGLTATGNLAQNVVIPMITRVVDAMNKNITEKTAQGSSPLQVVQTQVDPILGSPYVLEATQRFGRSIITIPLQNLGVPFSDVAGRLRSGHSRMDEELLALVARVGEGEVRALWDALFNNAGGNLNDVIGRQGQERLAVLAFFLAARAQADTPEGVNMDPSEWGAYVAAVMAGAGAAVQKHVQNRSDKQKTSLLVNGVPDGQQPVGDVSVDGDLYAAFLQQGGSPELLMATAYGDRRFEPEHMLKNAESLKGDWAQVLSMYANQVSFVRFDAMTEALRAAVTTEINTLAAEGSAPADPAELHARLREIAKCAKARDLEDLWHLARKVVCRTIFPHTDIEELLLAMEEEGKLHPEADVRQLALYATIRVMARWLAQQIQVSSLERY